MGTTPWKGQEYVKEGADHAASYVSWEDAVRFCVTLTVAERKAGRLGAAEAYRLPTEAEWEYACRAGSKTRFSFGDDAADLSDYAWWGGINGNGNSKNEHYAHRVGLKKANRWGLHDMQGNVWEWCSDWYVGKLAGGRDPTGPSGGSDRVMRGSAWNDFAAICRSARRNWSTPGKPLYWLGFRVALSSSDQ